MARKKGIVWMNDEDGVVKIINWKTGSRKGCK